MSMKLWKRKRPPREEKPLKEVSKIAHKVFDDRTIAVLVSFINAGVFKSLDYPLASGKEAIVFRATTRGGGHVAVKIFKYETAAFKKSAPYVEGDPRFKLDKAKHSVRAFVHLWARKEFANLRAAFAAGARVPEPVACKENVVIMRFLGEGGVPSALLEDVVVENPGVVLDEILDDVKKCFEAGVVHADLSSFNVIMHEGKPFLIDWAQGVSVKHPRAREFFEKDVFNILSFFKRLGVEKSFEDALAEATGE
jgi:RIO kinase 1